MGLADYVRLRMNRSKTGSEASVIERGPIARNKQGEEHKPFSAGVAKRSYRTGWERYCMWERIARDKSSPGDPFLICLS